MNKNKEEFNESSPRFPKLLYQSICYKKSETPIYIKCTKNVKKHNPKYSSNELLYSIFNSPLYCVYNKVATNFIKLIGIYHLIILHFHVVMATQDESAQNNCVNKLNGLFGILGMKEPVCKICEKMRIFGNYCNEPAVSISVTVFVFLFVIGIFCLICCNCCCKKSCCKKKKGEEGDFDYSSYMMGPDGQMYNPMFQGQMISPQMYQMGMMQPQMFPGQMMYPQMYQGGIQDAGMQMQGMQMPGMQMPGMQMPGMHNEEMQNQ